MTRSMKIAVLWFLAGVASLIAGLLYEPRRPLAIVACVLYFVVAVVSILRGRQEDPPTVSDTST